MTSGAADPSRVLPIRARLMRCAMLVCALYLILRFGARIAPASLGRYRDLVSSFLKLFFGASCTYMILVRQGRHSAADVGLVVHKRMPARILLGAGLGFVLSLTAFLIAWGAGELTVNIAAGEDTPLALDLVISAASLLLSAAFEEVIFRAGLTGALLGGVPPGLALAGPAAVFGLLHGLNPGATPLGIANTMLAGLFFGFLYLERNGGTMPSLGLAIGFHFAWNFCLAHVFGGPVSGNLRGASWLKSEPTASLWSGGSTYGLEGGLATTLVLFVGVGLALGYASPAVFRDPAVQSS